MNGLLGDVLWVVVMVCVVLLAVAASILAWSMVIRVLQL